MQWSYDNFGTIVLLNKEASNFLDFCVNHETCSLLYRNYDEKTFGSVYYIDFNKMIMYNERYRSKFYLIRDYVSKNNQNELFLKNSNKLINTVLNSNQFIPYCNYTPYYTDDYFNIQYPDIASIVILKTCNHKECHLRTCKTHNGELNDWNNECHDYLNISLINKENCKYIYNI